MLSLGLLTKGYIKTGHCLTGDCGPLRVFKERLQCHRGCLLTMERASGIGQVGNHQGEVSKFLQAYVESDLTVWGETQHRDNGNCPFCPHSEATQLSLSLYDPDASPFVISLPEPRVSVCQ